jgi:hypothetical protein
MEGEGVAEATCAAEGVHGPRKRKNNSSRNIFVFATSDSILNTRLMDPACQDDRMDLSARSQIVDADFLPRNALATARIRTIDIFCLCKGAHSISQSTFQSSSAASTSSPRERMITNSHEPELQIACTSRASGRTANQICQASKGHTYEVVPRLGAEAVPQYPSRSISGFRNIEPKSIDSWISSRGSLA